MRDDLDLPNDHEFKRFPRTLVEAFGPYAELTITHPRKRFGAVVFLTVLGVACAAIFVRLL